MTFAVTLCLNDLLQAPAAVETLADLHAAPVDGADNPAGDLIVYQTEGSSVGQLDVPAEHALARLEQAGIDAAPDSVTEL